MTTLIPFRRAKINEHYYLRPASISLRRCTTCRYTGISLISYSPYQDVHGQHVEVSDRATPSKILVLENFELRTPDQLSSLYRSLNTSLFMEAVYDDLQVQHRETPDPSQYSNQPSEARCNLVHSWSTLGIAPAMCCKCFTLINHGTFNGENECFCVSCRIGLFNSSGYLSFVIHKGHMYTSPSIPPSWITGSTHPARANNQQTSVFSSTAATITPQWRTV